MRRNRLANLRTAALVAGGFVVLRVVYRVVFGGGGGSGVLLLDLPRLPLPGPFVGIPLFGPVTSGGLAAAALGAVPFAAVIVGVALLGVVVDLRALLSRGAVRGPVRTISRALVVAWSTFPALRDSVARVRVARELRGERSLASLVVPVLEQTVERAIALGASMEVRGFAATRRPEPDCERPVVIRGASLGFGGEPIISELGLELHPGTVTLVTGPTGSGKSTLLHAMSGLFQHQLGGVQTGEIRVAGSNRLTTPPRETAGFVGVVSQSPRLSFVAETVADELGFALATRGVSPTIVTSRVADVANELQIAHLTDREIHQLSAGEACLVAIGAALISRPVLLLVDEPLAELDAAARARVVTLLERLAHSAGVCVVVAEHHAAHWGTAPDVALELALPADSLGILRPEQPELAGVTADALGLVGPEKPERAVAVVRGLTVDYGSRRAVDEVSLELAPGEIVALLGPNGAGKSSLLHAIARPRGRAVVTVDGVDVASLRGRRHRRARRRAVALVPEQFDDLLFTTTVAAECRRAAPGSAALLLQLLGRDRPTDQANVLQRHPRDLSAGERLCLVIAIQLSAHPTVLLVDEPRRGLDAGARELVAAALRRAADAGAAVLVATHDLDFAAAVATRTLELAAGRLHSRPAEARR